MYLTLYRYHTWALTVALYRCSCCSGRCYEVQDSYWTAGCRVLQKQRYKLERIRTTVKKAINKTEAHRNVAEHITFILMYSSDLQMWRDIYPNYNDFLPRCVIV
jgi:hypothetical protein